jgi:hypothetical protein
MRRFLLTKVMSAFTLFLLGIMMRERYLLKKKASLSTHGDLEVVRNSSASASAVSGEISAYDDFRFDVFEE